MDGFLVVNKKRYWSFLINFRWKTRRKLLILSSTMNISSNYGWNHFDFWSPKSAASAQYFSWSSIFFPPREFYLPVCRTTLELLQEKGNPYDVYFTNEETTVHFEALFRDRKDRIIEPHQLHFDLEAFRAADHLDEVGVEILHFDLFHIWRLFHQIIFNGNSEWFFSVLRLIYYYR